MKNSGNFVLEILAQMFKKKTKEFIDSSNPVRVPCGLFIQVQ